MRVGFVGLGAMGSGMAERVLAAGHSMAVYNRSADKAQALVEQGAVQAGTPAEAASCGVVVSMLTGDAALEAVSFGEAGIIAGLPEGGVHVSCSTISVAMSARLTAAHAAAGRHFVAATVLGRPPAAASGELFITVAGGGEPVGRVRPVLEAMSQRIFEIGQTPSMANLLKLSANFLIFSTIEQMAEVFAINAKAGIDRASVFEFLTGSFFNAPVHRNYGKLIVDGAFGVDGGTDVALALKDTGMMLAAAEGLAAPMPMASLVRDRLLACVAQGELQTDFAVLARQAERDAGLA